MSDTNVQAQISKLFADAADSSDRDVFAKIIESLQMQLQQEVDKAQKEWTRATSGSATEAAAGSRREMYKKALNDLTSGPLMLQLHMQYAQMKSLENIAATLRELTEEVKLITRPRELDKPAPSLKSRRHEP
jgi:hypothetical protein